ncbi:MAG: hypothetical protein A2W19_07785 [Spirochaetes bacterium RBG_16_49_21]|nr:MAG: hypothetical protein A2W19_07785 [Spirochaetes bacterium RBG_16_49_21]
MAKTQTISAGTTKPTPETIGKESGKIPVELSTRFLEHFSEQLYSSPQKAFEELISNGWDAGANRVDVRVSKDLNEQEATMCVLDNGESMNDEGLRQLWHIAYSPKSGKTEQYGRKIIGKFGIGKLATYVLAKKLTYICKSTDGIIRRVTMDYGDIDRQRGASEDRLISELQLTLYEVSEKEVEEALLNIYDGKVIFDLIRRGVPPPEDQLGEDEFGSPKSKLERPFSQTWTLVVLSDLKQTGRQLKIGILKRMLQAALPFGSEMAITLNDDLLVSSKINEPIMEEWILGPDLGIDSVTIEEDDDTSYEEEDVETVGSSTSNVDASVEQKETKIDIASGIEPTPFVDLPGIGRITGRARLFCNKISEGKSEVRGASNGFHVNVLGRVVNQTDPSFGEKNLSHAAWACFRMTVRADGLNDFLTTNREQFRQKRELKIFRAFLRRVFNKARTRYDNDQNAKMPDGGDVLVQSLGVLSLKPLTNVVSDALRTKATITDLFDESGITNREEKMRSWQAETTDNIKNALGEVKYENMNDESFVKFRLSDSSIIVNRNHPFVMEHSRTKAEKELMRTIAMVNLLSDVYALDIGVPPSQLESIRSYRDRLMRFRAMQRRRSGTYIAKLLLQMQHESDKSKLLEAVVSDSLRYLGFQVQDLAKPGEPEGIAKAFTSPTLSTPTPEDPHPALYSFSFDAKSSKHEVAQTGNIKLDGVVEHRKRYNANYALVIAPGYSDGAIATRCIQQKVTPITAKDLGKLLEYTVTYGAIPLTKLKELFDVYTPDETAQWVTDLESWLIHQRPLTIDTFLQALDNLKGKVPDVLQASTIAYECREKLKAVTVKEDDVRSLARGLSILIPDLVGVDNDKIFVNASSDRVAEAVRVQLDKLHSDDPLEVEDNGDPID